MKAEIRAMLIKAAQQRNVAYYSEVAELANLSMDNPDHRFKLGCILGEISTEEHENGHPLLSAVVVHKGDHLPGEGFFKLTKELGKQKADEDDDAFHTRELRTVFDHWTSV